MRDNVGLCGFGPVGGVICGRLGMRFGAAVKPVVPVSCDFCVSFHSWA